MDNVQLVQLINGMLEMKLKPIKEELWLIEDKISELSAVVGRQDRWMKEELLTNTMLLRNISSFLNGIIAGQTVAPNSDSEIEDLTGRLGFPYDGFTRKYYAEIQKAIHTVDKQ